MKTLLSLTLSLCLLCATTFAQGNSFKDIRHQAELLQLQPSPTVGITN